MDPSPRLLFEPAWYDAFFKRVPRVAIKNVQPPTQLA
jgi:hypothetical protein